MFLLYRQVSNAQTRLVPSQREILRRLDDILCRFKRSDAIRSLATWWCLIRRIPTCGFKRSDAIEFLT